MMCGFLKLVMTGSLPSSGPALFLGCVDLGTGHLPGPLAGSEQCLRQEAGRLVAVPAHLGSAWCWLELSSGRCLGSAARAQLGGCEAEP